VILIVKSPYVLPTVLPTVLSFCLALLAGCGQTGPLTMPKPPARPTAAAAAPPATPAPAQQMKVVTPPAPAAGVSMPIGPASANDPGASQQLNNQLNNAAPAANQR
jgi:hypothetical protein